MKDWLESDLARYEREHDESKLPDCCICGEKVGEYMYIVDGEIYCEECFKDFANSCKHEVGEYLADQAYEEWRSR